MIYLTAYCMLIPVNTIEFLLQLQVTVVCALVYITKDTVNY